VAHHARIDYDNHPIGIFSTMKAAPLAGDLCDRCSVLALVQVGKPGAGRLTLCGHHYGELELALVSAGWRLEFDGREKLKAR
jgi:hypothetical protein